MPSPRASASGSDRLTLRGVTKRSDVEIREVVDAMSFALLPACADPRFDHRSCDYWEDEVRGAKAARPSWWGDRPAVVSFRPRPRSDNPFAPAPRDDEVVNPFAPFPGTPAFNPFAPASPVDPTAGSEDAPRKLRQLDRGRGVFGSYAKVLILNDEPAGFAQFGPLSAYPRAQAIRELYPALPSTPLPAVITCIATTATARGRGLAVALIEAVATDLAERGFAAVESYPDLSLRPDESAAAHPAFWIRCGFDLAIEDDRYPVMRRRLD